MKSAYKVIWIRPETKRSSREQAKGRIRVCCIKLERFTIWSEMLIVFGDSWFSAKAI